MDTKKAKTNGITKLISDSKVIVSKMIVSFLKVYNFKQLNILAVLVIDSIINNVAIRNNAIIKPLIATISGLKSDIVTNNDVDRLQAIITDVLINGKQHKNKDMRAYYTANACDNLNNDYTRKAAAIISNNSILASGKIVRDSDIKWVNKDTYNKLCAMDSTYWQAIITLYCKFNKLDIKATTATIKRNLSKDNKDSKIQQYSVKAFVNAKTA